MEVPKNLIRGNQNRAESYLYLSYGLAEDCPDFFQFCCLRYMVPPGSILSPLMLGPLETQVLGIYEFFLSVTSVRHLILTFLFGL